MINRTFYRRALVIVGALIVFNVSVWIGAICCFNFMDIPKSTTAELTSWAILSFTIGMRHAFDADHIVAIDNITRRLIGRLTDEEGKGDGIICDVVNSDLKKKWESKLPLTVGLWFSLGHCTVVLITCIIIAAVVSSIQQQMESFGEIAGIVGTVFSCTLLLIIALVNMVYLVKIWKELHGSEVVEVKVGKTCLSKLHFITKPFHAYIVGFLFGLGFDTSTQIGLLALTATSTDSNLLTGAQIWSVLFFPLLFIASMSFLDTCDGIFMARLYGLAESCIFNQQRSRLIFNFVVTLASIVFALLVAFVQILGLLRDLVYTDSESSFWMVVDVIGDHSPIFGGFVIVFFILSLVVGYLVARSEVARSEAESNQSGEVARSDS